MKKLFKCKGRDIVMRKFGILSLLLVMFLTGCSVEIDTSSSKSDEFASKADELASTFMDAKDTLKPLKEKENLSSKDQEQIIKVINTLTDEIDEFKNEEAPFLAKKAKKVAVEVLNKKEKTLLNIKEKAEKETVTTEDVEKIIKTVSDDFKINLFDK
ncbi:hypothetical protein [Neobacillus niacini]|uniref:hypothetical protein n=1 Tax=Neobacillus niacini TaxID=86668 RepID=UPI0021CB0317|nr:hypothetical protein [Neobacillus niacini]MCM3765671.1 hypothetical protein [Neobacillus niacini]